MHKRKPIISIPMLIGIVMSVALHGAAFYGRGVCIYAPPKPLMEQGRTVVHLTLVPSMASQAVAPETQLSEPAVPSQDIPVPIPVKTAPEKAATADSRSIDSLEQDASLEEDKGVSAAASLTGAFRPTYPRVSKRRGETGTVTLSVRILADGTVAEVAIRQSSGYRRLDEAAVKAARKTSFTPAVRFGRNIDSATELSFTFRLTDD